MTQGFGGWGGGQATDILCESRVLHHISEIVGIFHILHISITKVTIFYLLL